MSDPFPAEPSKLKDNPLMQSFTSLIDNTNRSHLQTRDFAQRPAEAKKTPVVMVKTTDGELHFESIVPAQRHAFRDISTNDRPPWVGLHVERDGKAVTMECAADGNIRITGDPGQFESLLSMDPQDLTKQVTNTKGQIEFPVTNILDLHQKTQDGIQHLVKQATKSIVMF